MGLMDTSGSFVASYQWGPFGERISNSAPTIYNPVSYAGLYWDSETDLYFATRKLPFHFQNWIQPAKR